MKYSVMTKKNVDDQNKWTFDYFTQEALKKKPRSGIVFRKIPSTRGFVTKCVKYWAGHADDPTPIWKERCWDTYEPDNPNIPDPGTGGCRHCYEEAYLDPDGGGGGGGSGNYTPPSAPLPVVSKDATFDKYPEVDKIFNCLIADGTANAFVKDFLARYVGKDASFNLTFTTAPLQYDDKEHVYGQFQYKDGSHTNEGIITLNELSFNDRTPLENACTLIHECMHAYIHSFVYSKDNTDKKSTLDEAFNKYESQITWRNRPNLTENEEHDGIAILWVKALAEELHKIHKSQPGYNKFWQNTAHDEDADIKSFYIGIAWSGLKKTAAYESVSKEEKSQIAKMSKKNIVNGLSKTWDCNK